MTDADTSTERPFSFFSTFHGEFTVTGSEVYDDISKPERPQLDFTITSAVPHVELVSRQFRAEVEAQTGKSVAVSNTAGRIYPLTVLRLNPSIRNNLKQVNINLRALCLVPCNITFASRCYAVEHMRENIKWLERTLDQLERTTSVHVGLGIHLDHDVKAGSKLSCGVGLDEALGKVVAMERIVSLKVYKRGRWNTNKSPNDIGEIRVRWTKEKGWDGLHECEATVHGKDVES
ncbi:hypothetical protein LTR37_003448 [Vermiconidia calcicola]|uniref:Uncharacterized protein n=1 Tax=Vermiconidia calcicola TaxID=1690605 RepID=A0ACC3NPW0_9PEZI|nr:hypothetical protein LTR37_003448 [Vermiconidia calcicola]